MYNIIGLEALVYLPAPFLSRLVLTYNRNKSKNNDSPSAWTCIRTSKIKNKVIAGKIVFHSCYYVIFSMALTYMSTYTCMFVRPACIAAQGEYSVVITQIPPMASGYEQHSPESIPLYSVWLLPTHNVCIMGLL